MSQATTLSADGSTGWHLVKNGSGVITGNGDFGGGTATVQVKNPQGNAVAIEAFTEDFTKVIDFPISVEIRVTLASSTSPDLDIDIWGT